MIGEPQQEDIEFSGDEGEEDSPSVVVTARVAALAIGGRDDGAREDNGPEATGMWLRADHHRVHADVPGRVGDPGAGDLDLAALRPTPTSTPVKTPNLERGNART